MADAKILHSIESDGPSRALARTDQATALYRDIDARRRQLAHSIAELRHAVTTKLDVKRQAKRLVQSGKEHATQALGEVRTRIQRRPALYIGVGLGLLALGAASIVALRRARPPRWQRSLESQLGNLQRALTEGVHIRIGYPDPR